MYEDKLQTATWSEQKQRQAIKKRSAKNAGTGEKLLLYFLTTLEVFPDKVIDK